MLFNNGSNSIAQELGFTDDEYQFCKRNEKAVINLIRDNFESTDEDVIENFADRYYSFKNHYPGAIGYFIGFRIVEEYVKKNGKDSWRDIYTMEPKDVLHESGILY